jgi:hypothetical protein
MLNKNCLFCYYSVEKKPLINKFVETVNINKKSGAFSKACYLLNSLQYIELSNFSTNSLAYYYYYYYIYINNISSRQESL